MTRKTQKSGPRAIADAGAATHPQSAARAVKLAKAAKSKKTPAKPPEPAPPPAGPRGKIGVVVGMLRRTEGATIPDLMEATGWQAHSVRGALAGAIKKKLGLKVSSQKLESGRVYRIEAADDAA